MKNCQHISAWLKKKVLQGLKKRKIETNVTDPVDYLTSMIFFTLNIPKQTEHIINRP